MDELARWLGQQLDEDERIAQATAWCWSAQIDNSWTARPPRDEEEGWTVWSKGSALMASGLEEADAQHIAAHDPARVLREIDADRALVAAYEQACRKRTEIADEHWGAAGPSGGLSAVERWKEHDAVAEALKPHVLRRAAVYADRPGYRDDWRP